MRFRPLLDVSDLPSIGSGFERDTFDLKTSYDLTKTADMAIDVAAFANHLGGTVLVGAAESKGVVGAYKPMHKADCNDLKNAISKAVGARCRPSPRIDLVPLEKDAGHVLAVNVWPQLGGPVGVRVDADKSKGGYGGGAWIFPVRTGTDAHYVDPENLAMYMLPQIRRVVVLLAQIPTGAKVRCRIYENNQWADRRLDGFDVERNLLFLVAGEKTTHVPLDGLERVFQGADGQWQLHFSSPYVFFESH
jgi:hypothetical protein